MDSIRVQSYVYELASIPAHCVLSEGKTYARSSFDSRSVEVGHVHGFFSALGFLEKYGLYVAQPNHTTNTMELAESFTEAAPVLRYLKRIELI